MAWEGAGEVLKNAEDIESSPSGTDVSYEYEDEASNPKGLPMQCVRLADAVLACAGCVAVSVVDSVPARDVHSLCS